MQHRINAIIRITWIDLWNRRIGAGFLGMLGLIVLLPSWLMTHINIDSPQGMPPILHPSLEWAGRWGVVFASHVAATSVAHDVSQRSLSAVMIRPIARWEYLLGQALGISAMFSQYIALCVLATLLVGVGLPAALNSAVLWDAGRALGGGITWIFIILPLAAVTSYARCAALLIAGFVVQMRIDSLADAPGGGVALARVCLHYVTKVDGPHATGWLSVLNLVENLGYAAGVFMLCAWVFERQDLRLRA